MFSSLLGRIHLVKLTTIVVMAAQLLGWVTLAQASDAPPPVVPPPDELTTVRRALREFDRFLDHHPLLEDDLRLNPALIRDSNYLKKNPELRTFAGANPDVLSGLKIFPRFFLFRAVLREANAPLRYADIAQLKDVLDQQPALERALNQNPELIRDPAFLQAHAPLREFFTQHAALGQVFLPRREFPAKRRP
jgi:hypothetical protein